MGRYERRQFMALDDACNYCRQLQEGKATPSLFKVCSALRTLDKAVESMQEPENGRSRLSPGPWQQLRNYLYNKLLATYPGYFLVYEGPGDRPCSPTEAWPPEGRVEFYPESGRRREDAYTASFDNLSEPTMLALRWCYSEGRQQLAPSDFPDEMPRDDEEEQATDLMERLYEMCQQEATQGKKNAHRKWWQLYWDANSCGDKRQRHELQKEMVELQAVWGRPN